MPGATRIAEERTLQARSPAEIVKIGKAIYENDVLPNIPHVKKGMMVVLDIASGDYEVDIQGADAGRRLKRRRPDAVMYTARVGYSAVYRTGYMRARRPADD